MKRHWKRWLTLVVAVYFGVSWIAFLLRPRIHASPEIPPEAIKAITEYRDQDDYLWEYPWGIPASVFWAEPLTHREFRTRELVLHKEKDTSIRVFCRSTERVVWFILEGDEWKLNHNRMLLTF